MSTTPRTDALHERINASDDCHAEDILTATAFARELELEAAGHLARLKEWEAAFETTNPAQAKAEHAAVLEKRGALQRENQALRAKVAAQEALAKSLRGAGPTPTTSP